MITKEQALKKRREVGQTHWTAKQRKRMCELLDLQNSGKCVIAYWNSDAHGFPANGGTTDGWRARKGLVQTMSGDLPVLCGPGAFHATAEPHRWKGCRVWIVALFDAVVRDVDKLGALKREFVGEVLPHEAVFSASLFVRTTTDFSCANLYGANLSLAYLRGANLSGANLSGADLYGADLSGADLSRANLRGANLSGADLSRAYLSGANLSGANLSIANLSGADLSGADLSRADLSRANLRGANLSGADLSRADLSRANLRGANLSGADLSGAYLSGANLSLANLSGANLSGAIRYLDDAAIPGWKFKNGILVQA